MGDGRRGGRSGGLRGEGWTMLSGWFWEGMLVCIVGTGFEELRIEEKIETYSGIGGVSSSVI